MFDLDGNKRKNQGRITSPPPPAPLQFDSSDTGSVHIHHVCICVYILYARVLILCRHNHSLLSGFSRSRGSLRRMDEPPQDCHGVHDLTDRKSKKT